MVGKRLRLQIKYPYINSAHDLKNSIEIQLRKPPALRKIQNMKFSIIWTFSTMDLIPGSTDEPKQVFFVLCFIHITSDYVKLPPRSNSPQIDLPWIIKPCEPGGETLPFLRIWIITITYHHPILFFTWYIFLCNFIILAALIWSAQRFRLGQVVNPNLETAILTSTPRLYYTWIEVTFESGPMVSV